MKAQLMELYSFIHNPYIPLSSQCPDPFMFIPALFLQFFVFNTLASYNCSLCLLYYWHRPLPAKIPTQQSDKHAKNRTMYNIVFRCRSSCRPFHIFNSELSRDALSIIVEVRVLLNCMGFLSQRNVNQNKNLEPGEITQQSGALATVQKMRLQFPAPIRQLITVFGSSPGHPGSLLASLDKYMHVRSGKQS